MQPYFFYAKAIALWETEKRRRFKQFKISLYQGGKPATLDIHIFPITSEPEVGELQNLNLKNLLVTSENNIYALNLMPRPQIYLKICILQ